MPPEAREEHKHASINTFAQALLPFAFSVKNQSSWGYSERKHFFFFMQKYLTCI